MAKNRGNDRKLPCFVTENQFTRDIKTTYQHYYVYDIYKSIIDDFSKVNTNESRINNSAKARLVNSFQQLSKRSDLEMDIRDNSFNIFHDLYFYKHFGLIWNKNNVDDTQPSSRMIYLLRLFSKYHSKEDTFTVRSVGNGSFCDINAEGMESVNREMTDLGIINLVKKEKYKSEVFAFNPLTMEKFIESVTENLDKKDRNKFVKNFITFLIFATEFYDFGKLGKELLYRLEHIEKAFSEEINPKCFRYKNNYIAGCLCEFILIDIMYCIDRGDYYQKYTLVNKSELIAKPLKIFTDCTTGIQYATVYLPEYRSLYNLNVADINDISDVKISPTQKQAEIIKADFENAEVFWKDKNYLVIPNAFSGNLAEDSEYFLKGKTAQVTLKITSEMAYKLKSLKSDYGESLAKTDDDTYVLSLSYLHISEIMPKIRKLYGFIEDIQSEDNLFEIVKEDFEKLCAVYSENKTEILNPTPDKEKYKKQINLKSEKIKKEVYPHSLLYNDFFSKQVKNVFDVLSVLGSNENERTLEETVQQVVNNDWPYSFNIVEKEENGENKTSKNNRIKELNEFFELAGHDSENKTVDNFRLNIRENFYYNTFPITSMEGMWLCWVLEDDYARLFLTDEEIYSIKKVLENTFKDNKVFSDNIFGKVKNHKLFARKKNLPSKGIFQKILHDTCNHTNINIEYNNKILSNVLPKYLEFSKKDNSIWLVTNRNSFLLHKIQDVKYSPKGKSIKFDSEKGKIERKAVYVEFLNNTFEFKKKLLSEFAPWKKNFKGNICGKNGINRIPNNIYIYFYTREENEIYNRLLSYGAEIKINGCRDGIDKGIEDLKYIKNLLDIQKNLFKPVDKEQ